MHTTLTQICVCSHWINYLIINVILNVWKGIFFLLVILSIMIIISTVKFNLVFFFRNIYLFNCFGTMSFTWRHSLQTWAKISEPFISIMMQAATQRPSTETQHFPPRCEGIIIQCNITTYTRHLSCVSLPQCQKKIHEYNLTVMLARICSN